MEHSQTAREPELGDLSGLAVDTPLRRPTAADDLEYAGFWVRVAATLIDTLLLVVITTPLLVWIYGWGYFGDGLWLHGPADLAINWIAPAVATIAFWLTLQATPGKLALSVRVVDAETGRTLSGGQAIARYVCYILSALPLCLGFIWAGFDRRKQGWHDKIAQTVVVRAKDHGPERVRFSRQA